MEARKSVLTSLVATLALSHGKAMHLFVISKDLQSFAHLHPEPRGGLYVLEHTFEAGGDYTLFVDYARPDGHAPVDRHSLRVEGPSRPAVAMAHFVVLSADGQDFLHVHPLDTAPGEDLAAHTAFPRALLYKLWVQVQRRGEVVTVPFVLRVSEAKEHT